MNIGNIHIDNGVLLAPMESVTDMPFRIMCRRMGADIVYTEFIASEALVRDVKKSLDKMTYDEEERPVGVQIFGGNIDSMVGSAKIVEDSGADFLDINCGCWVKKVVGNNAGSALLKKPDYMAEMAHEMVKTVDIPVTAKTRLGWDRNSINIIEVAQKLEKAGIAALTVHCRTREMGMNGEADWSWIPKIKEAVSMPIILNGDIKSPADVIRAFETTGCDAVMIARAAIGNPFIFKKAKELMSGLSCENEISLEERFFALREHLRLSVEYKGFPRGFIEFRKHYSGYLKGLYKASEIRRSLMEADVPEEAERILDEYFEILQNRELEYEHELVI